MEQNDEWAVPCARYITLETIAPLSDDPVVGLPAVAARPTRLMPASAAPKPSALRHVPGDDPASAERAAQAPCVAMIHCHVTDGSYAGA
jgi:hypothetical protein